MTHSFGRRSVSLVLALFFLLFSLHTTLFAQGLIPNLKNSERSADRPERDDRRALRRPNADAPDAMPVPAMPQPNEFVVPADATPQQLLEMADRLMNTEKEFDTEEEYKAWVNKMIQTVFLIANKIIAANPDDALYVKAVNLKGEMIYYHGTTNPDTFKVYEKFVRSLADDERLQKTEEGRSVADSHLAGYLHWGCTKTVQLQGSAEDLKRYVDEFQTLLLRNPEFVSMITELIYPVSELANDKNDPALMKNVFGDMVVALKNSSNEDLKEAAKGLEGMVRFADLTGKPFEVVGTLANGQPFDSSVLKNKVVLVNFWGTWVEPCLAQYPDLLALYIQYQDKGFEIVGYSLDDDVAKLNDYLTSKKVLWPNLSETLSQKNQIPLLTEFYGITGLPTMILVGRDGRVIETDIDMDKLEKKLEEIFKK